MNIQATVATASPIILAIGRSFIGFIMLINPRTIKSTEVKRFLLFAGSIAYNLLGGKSRINDPTPTIIHKIPTKIPKKLRILKTR